MADDAQDKSVWTKTLVPRPKPGQTASRTRKAVSDDFAAFTQMTGNNNPLHYDKDFERQAQIRWHPVGGDSDGSPAGLAISGT